MKAGGLRLVLDKLEWDVLEIDSTKVEPSIPKKTASALQS